MNTARLDSKETTSSTPPLRILAVTRYGDELAAALKIPHVLTTNGDQSDEEIAERMRHTDVLVSGNFKAAWISQGAAALRLIAVTGTGTDEIQWDAVPNGCRVSTVYGHERALAEHVAMLMLVLQRQLFACDAKLRRGDWGWDDSRPGELGHRNLLLLGLGHIGGELTRWARFMNMRVTGLTRSPSPARREQLKLDTIAGLSDLRDHLPQADFVVVALPRSAETIGFVGQPEFKLMKPTAFLINVGRGPVVDEAALYTALRDRTIAGAGLDVWYQYPGAGKRGFPSRLPFHELDNVVMTPHNGGMTLETMHHRWTRIADNIQRLVLGQPLLNVVWPITPTAN